jgi:hypothetical protein
MATDSENGQTQQTQPKKGKPGTTVAPMVGHPTSTTTRSGYPG